MGYKRVLARLLIALGLLMLVYYFGTGLYAYIYQGQLRSQWEAALDDEDKTSTASGGSGTNSNTDTGVPDLSGEEIFGRLVIGRLNLDVIVLEGADQAKLMRGPGHIKGTAWPHEGRNTAISGHRTTFGSPFANLNRLEDGDLIELTTLQGRFNYVVSGRDVVPPNDVSVIGQVFRDRLTLTTCDPPGSAARRLAVWAKLVD